MSEGLDFLDVMALFCCGLYLNAESATSGRRWLLFVGELCCLLAGFGFMRLFTGVSA